MDDVGAVVQCVMGLWDTACGAESRDSWFIQEGNSVQKISGSLRVRPCGKVYLCRAGLTIQRSWVCSQVRTS